MEPVISNQVTKACSVKEQGGVSRLSATVRISGQNYNFVNLFKNGFTNLCSLLLYIQGVLWINPIAALDEGSNAGCQGPRQSSRLIAAHAHHEPAIARANASQLIACVSVFDIYKFVCDRNALARAIKAFKSFSEVFTYAQLCCS